MTGHVLSGLQHTFENGCDEDLVEGGDMVADTVRLRGSSIILYSCFEGTSEYSLVGLTMQDLSPCKLRLLARSCTEIGKDYKTC